MVIQMDEAHLNKNTGNMQKSARPQSDEVGMWGAMVEGRTDMFLFRVLNDAKDALEGKPRRHQEMRVNLLFLGIDKKTIFVSDSRRATISAVKAFKEAKR